MIETSKPDIANGGAGLSAEQMGEVLDETGLADAVLNLDEAERSRKSPKPGSREELEGVQAFAREQNGESQDAAPIRPLPDENPRVQTAPGADGPAYHPASPQAPPQHPAVQQLQQLSQAFNEVTANLQALAANRQALTQQHGPAAVAAMEAHLRGTLSQLDGMGQHVRAQIDQQVQQAQRHQQAQAMEQGRMFQKQLCREFQVNEAELADMANAGFGIMEELGVPRSRVLQASPEEARAILAMVRDRKAKETAEKKAALAEKKAKQARALARARPDPNKPIYTPHGVYRPGDGSLAEAADAFMRLGVC